jgi:hypothetical protein
MLCFVSKSGRLGSLGRPGKALTQHQLAFFLHTIIIVLHIFDDFFQAMFCFVYPDLQLKRLGRSGKALPPHQYAFFLPVIFVELHIFDDFFVSGPAFRKVR